MTYKTLLLSLCLWAGMVLITPRSEAADAALTIDSVISAPFPYGERVGGGREGGGPVHDFTLHRSWQRVFEATHEFPDRHLGQPSGT